MKTDTKLKRIILLIHRAVKAVEPWSILVAVIALGITLLQLESDRKVREATMIGLVSDRLEATRALQWDGRAPATRLNTGQARMLETMADLSVDLTNMDLSEIYLRDIQLPEANLTDSDLVCSDLSNANLSGAVLNKADLAWAKLGRADITGAKFIDADLYGARVISLKSAAGADFTKATFRSTELRNLDLSQSKGLTDKQVRAACGRNVSFPGHITAELEPCSDDEKDDQRCQLSGTDFHRRFQSLAADVSSIERRVKDLKRDVSTIRRILEQ